MNRCAPRPLRSAATVLALLLVILPAAAWDDCPYGLSDDPAPGRCALYLDTDGDGICDHSQAAPAEGVREAPPSPADGPPGAAETPGFGLMGAAVACGAAAGWIRRR